MNVTDYLPSGSRLTYSGTWGFSLSGTDPHDALASVSNDLATNQGITVESSNIDSSLLGGKVTITLGLLTSGDHAQVDDVRAIVDHAFYIAINTLPDSSSITSVTPPGGQAQGTGAPTSTPPSPASLGDETCSLTNLAACLPSSGTVMIVVGLVVVGLIAIAYTSSRL